MMAVKRVIQGCIRVVMLTVVLYDAGTNGQHNFSSDVINTVPSLVESEDTNLRHIPTLSNIYTESFEDSFLRSSESTNFRAQSPHFDSLQSSSTAPYGAASGPGHEFSTDSTTEIASTDVHTLSPSVSGFELRPTNSVQVLQSGTDNPSGTLHMFIDRTLGLGDISPSLGASSVDVASSANAAMLSESILSTAASQWELTFVHSSSESNMESLSGVWPSQLSTPGLQISLLSAPEIKPSSPSDYFQIDQTLYTENSTASIDIVDSLSIFVGASWELNDSITPYFKPAQITNVPVLTSETLRFDPESIYFESSEDYGHTGSINHNSSGSIYPHFLSSPTAQIVSSQPIQTTTMRPSTLEASLVSSPSHSTLDVPETTLFSSSSETISSPEIGPLSSFSVTLTERLSETSYSYSSAAENEQSFSPQHATGSVGVSVTAASSLTPFSTACQNCQTFVTTSTIEADQSTMIIDSSQASGRSHLSFSHTSQTITDHPTDTSGASFLQTILSASQIFSLSAWERISISTSADQESDFTTLFIISTISSEFSKQTSILEYEVRSTPVTQSLSPSLQPLDSLSSFPETEPHAVTAVAPEPLPTSRTVERIQTQDMLSSYMTLSSHQFQLSLSSALSESVISITPTPHVNTTLHLASETSMVQVSSPSWSSPLQSSVVHTPVETILPSGSSELWLSVDGIMSTTTLNITTTIPVVTAHVDVLISLAFVGDCKKIIQPQYADSFTQKLQSFIMNVTHIHDISRIVVRNVHCNPNRIPIMIQNVDKDLLFSYLNKTFSIDTSHRYLEISSDTHKDFVAVNLTNYEEISDTPIEKGQGDVFAADIVVIATASCICVILVTAGTIIFAREIYFKKISERFNFSDSPRMPLKTENVALTSIPKHATVYNDVEMSEERSVDEAYCNPYDAEYSTISSPSKTSFRAAEKSCPGDGSDDKDHTPLGDDISDGKAETKTKNRAPGPPASSCSGAMVHNKNDYGLVIGLSGFSNKKESKNTTPQEQQREEDVNNQYAVPQKMSKNKVEGVYTKKTSSISSLPQLQQASSSQVARGGKDSPLPPPRHLRTVEKANGTSDSHETLLPNKEDDKVKTTESRTHIEGGVDNPSFSGEKTALTIGSTESFHF